MIIARTGLSQSQAEQAVMTTVNFLRERLPAEVANEIDNVLVGMPAGEMASGREGMRGR